MFQIFELGKLPKKEGNNGPGGGGGGGGKSGGVGVGEGGEKVFLILFDVEYDHPFEEAYSIVFQLFDYTWNAMKATYMDYPNVIKAVLEKVWTHTHTRTYTCTPTQTVTAWQSLN